MCFIQLVAWLASSEDCWLACHLTNMCLFHLDESSKQGKSEWSHLVCIDLFYPRGCHFISLHIVMTGEVSGEFLSASCHLPACPVQTVPPASCPVRKGPQFYREWQDIILGLMSPQYVCQDCSECAITDTFSSPPSAWCGCQRWGSLSPCDWWAECHLWSELLLCSDTSLQSERETGKYWIIITFVTIKLSN